mmetsp:Transcript_6538/g.14270  ORF Transcript_6538/g.14270 Transcript_6538/m.14270 type:complete len:137 (+) Transcript_6538:93-503(+)|eukprot:CAMPEP_0178418004 /NCGR_PEP_ID=MMETSP0689_2-20121128/24864_1 /TAXON_ID=160604 /ORGANISM="Amphidinium massartii, Strain CS-259" /LENGTH=136 /DNA_ID=CAMNT_0020039383 /DNA_START=93 /DNA_END=503 /DNA_ORIENTATION=+
MAAAGPGQPTPWTRTIPGYGGHKPYAWSREDDKYRGPHDPAPPRDFHPHIACYLGHIPAGWTSKHEKAKDLQDEDDGKLADADAPEPRSVHAVSGYTGHQPFRWDPRLTRTTKGTTQTGEESKPEAEEPKPEGQAA